MLGGSVRGIDLEMEECENPVLWDLAASQTMDCIS